MNFDNSKYKSTMIENQKKEFQRFKNKNEKELLGMIQYELKREWNISLHEDGVHIRCSDGNQIFVRIGRTTGKFKDVVLEF